MGGKKKTKWRKLPLAEFTKDVHVNQQTSSEGGCKSDLLEEERKEPYVQAQEDATENNVQTNYDTTDYADGVWFPTSHFVYNPSEVVVYPNFVMPADVCYYYYTLNNVPRVPEYPPVPYQEYCTQPVKDTIYLLLPAQTLRPSVGLPHTNLEWQNRRRRRRYEGYAEYADIPEKGNYLNCNKEERERGKKSAQYANSRWNNVQSNNSKEMTSFSDTSLLNNTVPNQGNVLRNNELNEIKQPSSENYYEKENVSLLSQEMDRVQHNTRKMRKSFEVCRVHAMDKPEKCALDEQDSDSASQKKHAYSTDIRVENSLATSNGAKDTKESGKCASSFDEPNSSEAPESAAESISIQEPGAVLKLEVNSDSAESKGLNKATDELTTNTAKATENSVHNKRTDIVANEIPDTGAKSQNLQQTDKTVSFQTNSSLGEVKGKEQIDNICQTHLQSSLPDIVNVMSKPVPHRTCVKSSERSSNSDFVHKSPFLEKTDLENEKSSISKSLLSHTNFLPSFFGSDNETEIDLKHLTHFHSLQTNQSIYKLAYDENVTDQSASNSRSPSPIDPVSQVPSSITNAEILIHEADSGSDAGSEDVELLPHRYESETFLNDRKHLYVNKLSLAVELLRTQETLPYDEEFKRVVGENNHVVTTKPVHSEGKVNLGFVDDSYTHPSFNYMDKFTFNNSGTFSNLATGRQSDASHSNISAIMSEEFIENPDEESCEVAKEATTQIGNNQDSTEEVIAGYRRFGVQARHYFSPRAALVNPCFCCIIM